MTIAFLTPSQATKKAAELSTYGSTFSVYLQGDRFVVVNGVLYPTRVPYAQFLNGKETLRR